VETTHAALELLLHDLLKLSGGGGIEPHLPGMPLRRSDDQPFRGFWDAL
jgi:hypothetical protein